MTKKSPTTMSQNLKSGTAISSGTVKPPISPAMPEAMPETKPQASAADLETGSKTEDFSHLEGLAKELSESERKSETAEKVAKGEAAPEVLGVGSDGLFTYPVFKETCEKGFLNAGMFADLETLRDAPKRPTWPGASAALYATLKDTPSLHFLLKPGSVWFQRLAAIGLFTVPVALSCKMEINIKRHNAQARAANENARQEAGSASGMDDGDLQPSPQAVNEDIPVTVNETMTQVA